MKFREMKIEGKSKVNEIQGNGDKNANKGKGMEVQGQS